MEVWDAIRATGEDHLIAKVERSMDIIERTIDLYGLRGVAFSFNGGKDSTVLLHLIRAALARHQATDNGLLASHEAKNPQNLLDDMVTFFFHHDEDFPEIIEFVNVTNQRYGLGMQVLRGDFKAGIEGLLNRTEVRAIYLGTRRGDPNAIGQEVFCPSSKGWPAFMRVNPVLDWTYHDVWAFLKLAALPYCLLYDYGFTSLGSVSNTLPNELLRKEDGTYAPAHALPDARLERAGRVRKDGMLERRPSVVSKSGTIGLLLIGDEMLSAKVDDVNMKYLCGELRAAGWLVQRAVFVRDDVDAIAAEVQSLSDGFDNVITAGGVGPTLDDVTMRGVAKAFGRCVSRHSHLEARLRSFFGPDLAAAHLKMAEIPSGSELALIDYTLPDGSLSPFPLVRFRNVYVLPGVPALLRQKWAAVRKELVRGGEDPFHSVVLRLRLGSTDEVQVAAALEATASIGDGAVSVGSYPLSEQSDGCGVALSLESKDQSALAAARERLVALLPSGVVASEHHDTDKALNSPADAPTLQPAAKA